LCSVFPPFYLSFLSCTKGADVIFVYYRLLDVVPQKDCGSIELSALKSSVCPRSRHIIRSSRSLWRRGGLDLFRRPRVEGCRPPGEADVRSGKVLEFNVTQMISDQLM